MKHPDITPVGIGEIIFLIIVVGGSLVAFVREALKDDKKQ